VVDTEKQRVTHKVEVGNRPHSVILSKGGKQHISAINGQIMFQWSILPHSSNRYS